MEGKKQRTLYFEGVGADDTCPWKETSLKRVRIRTVFMGHDGNPRFLEVTRGSVPKSAEHYACISFLKLFQKTATDKKGNTYWYWVQEREPIPAHDMVEDKIRKYVPTFGGYGEYVEETRMVACENYRYPFTKSGIVTFLHDIGYGFDSIEVLPDLSGYRAMREHMFNCPKDRPFQSENETPCFFGDRFVPDPDMIAWRESVEERIIRKDKESKISNPCFSLWVDETDPNILHYKNFRRNNLTRSYDYRNYLKGRKGGNVDV